MHPGWPLSTSLYLDVKTTLHFVNHSIHLVAHWASLCVASRANSPAIPLSSRLGGPAPHRSRCSGGSIHGLTDRLEDSVLRIPGARAGQVEAAVSATTSAAFRPAWWLPGPHAQTFAGRYMRPRAAVPLERRRIATPDGDFLDLDYAPEPATGAPVVVLLHGLEGSTRRGYMCEMFRQLFVRGLRGVGMNFRGCGGEPNGVARFYHSGETGDLAHVVEELRGRHPGRPIGAAGFSLGGNVLLKHLGERGHDAGIAAAVAVSVPYDLAGCAARLSGGLAGRTYGSHFLRALRRKVRAKRQPARGCCRCRAGSGGPDAQRLRRRADGPAARLLRSRRLLRPCRCAPPPPQHPGADAPRAVP